MKDINVQSSFCIGKGSLYTVYTVVYKEFGVFVFVFVFIYFVIYIMHIEFSLYQTFLFSFLQSIIFVVFAN